MNDVNCMFLWFYYFIEWLKWGVSRGQMCVYSMYIFLMFSCGSNGRLVLLPLASAVVLCLCAGLDCGRARRLLLFSGQAHHVQLQSGGLQHRSGWYEPLITPDQIRSDQSCVWHLTVSVVSLEEVGCSAWPLWTLPLMGSGPWLRSHAMLVRCLWGGCVLCAWCVCVSWLSSDPLSQTWWPTWTSLRLTTLCWRPARRMRRWVVMNWSPSSARVRCEGTRHAQIWSHVHYQMIQHNT